MLQICVEKATINKEPFRNILKSSFQKLIENKINELDAAGCALNLKDKNLCIVKNHIIETAIKMRDHISREVKGQMLLIMIDIATRKSRSVLGVSIQYILNGVHVVRTTGLIELQDRTYGLMKFVEKMMKVQMMKMKR